MSDLNDVEVQEIERKLREKLLEVEASLAQEGEEQIVELDQARMGRISRIDAIIRQEIAVKQKQRLKQLRKDLRNALMRLTHDPNDFGFCEECDEPIPLKRLLVKPSAQYCIACQRLQELR